MGEQTVKNISRTVGVFGLASTDPAPVLGVEFEFRKVVREIRWDAFPQQAITNAFRFRVGVLAITRGVKTMKANNDANNTRAVASHHFARLSWRGASLP